MKPYYPRDNEDRATWWENILTNASPILTAKGFSSGEVIGILGDATLGVYLYRTLPDAYEEIGKRVTGFRRDYLDAPDGTATPTEPPMPSWPTVPPARPAGIEARRILWVQRLKNNPLYNPGTDGATLRLEPTGSPFDPGTYQQDLYDVESRAAASVRARFHKAGGEVQRVNLYGRPKNTGTMRLLGTFVVSPANVAIPLTTPGTPEAWELEARGVIKDAEIGLPSEIVEIVVRG